MALDGISSTQKFKGLSTDTKPTDNVPAMSEFIETDTGDKYEYSGTSWNKTGTDGAAHVTDGISGVARNRYITVTTDTLPVLATSGVATYTSPGVRGIKITGVRLVSGTVPLTGAINWVVRYAVDAANDAAAALLLPDTTPTSSATADIGQVGAFNVMPVYIPDTEAAGDLRVGAITLAAPVYIDVTDPITRLDFVHDIGGSVVLQLTIEALEAV